MLGTAWQSTSIMAELFLKGNRRHKLLFSDVRLKRGWKGDTQVPFPPSDLKDTFPSPPLSLYIYYQTKTSWKHLRAQPSTLLNIDFDHSKRNLENNIKVLGTKKWLLKIGTLKPVPNAVAGIVHIFRDYSTFSFKLNKHWLHCLNGAR